MITTTSEKIKNTSVGAVGWILIILLVGLYLAVILPALGGVSFDSKTNGNSLLFMSAIVFSYLWKRLGKGGWKGFFVGGGIAIVIAAIPSGIDGFKAGQSKGFKEGFMDGCTKQDKAAGRQEFCACIAARMKETDTIESVKALAPACASGKNVSTQ